ncbi:MAG: alpha/beta fold hydrolase [Polyangiaceae bacterium]
MTPLKLELLFIAALSVSLLGCLSFHRGPMPGEPAGARFAEIEGARVRYVDSGESAPAAPPAAPQQAEGATDASDGSGAPAPQQGDAPVAPAAERPTVVLIHGFASALDTWDTVRPVLEQRYRVIALDLKGFGWTDRPEGDYSPEAQARLVLALMDARGVKRAALVAHSWGSSVALQVALLAPERVTKLALYDAWVYEEQLPAFFHWARMGGVGEALFRAFYTERADERIRLAFYDKKWVTEALVESIDAALERPGTVAAALAAVRGQRYSEVEGRYRKVQKPTLLLWGRDDRVTTLRFGERLSRDLPHASLVTYPRCGHFPMLEAREASTRDLLSFLGGTP